MANWSEREVEAIVEDYFAMLGAELRGDRYNKSEHRRALMPNLKGRSNGSIELKHANISALMIELGMPYIAGYKPRGNYQRQLLPDAVLEYLAAHPEFAVLMEEDADRVPTPRGSENILTTLTDAPETRTRGVREESSRPRSGKRNYLEIEASNRRLGAAGEAFVLDYENARLLDAGKGYLADRIEQVSETLGDGEGYDIRSYELDGSDRFIEAKTTKYGIDTPFFISNNEIRFSHRHAVNFYLYRVFDFRNRPGLYFKRGWVSERFSVEPVTFRAYP